MASGLGLRHLDLGSPPNIRVVSHQKNKGNRYHDSWYEMFITILEILALNRPFSHSCKQRRQVEVRVDKIQ